jgi:hypothetical protein
MKSGLGVVIDYSSTHENEIPDGPLRRRMELHRAPLARPTGHGRPRTHSLREILNAIFYLLKTGCQWRLLPHDFPRWARLEEAYASRRFPGTAEAVGGGTHVLVDRPQQEVELMD